MPTGEIVESEGLKKRIEEGRELTKPLVPPPPPPRTPRPKESADQEGPDKRRMRYLLRRALFATGEASGLYPVIGDHVPELQRVLNLDLTPIRVALREKLFELHDQGAPMADVPEDDSEQLAMQYLGEITPASSLSNEPLSGKDIADLSRRLGGVPESERIEQIREAIGPELDIPGLLPGTKESLMEYQKAVSNEPPGRHLEQILQRAHAVPVEPKPSKQQGRFMRAVQRAISRMRDRRRQAP